MVLKVKNDIRGIYPSEVNEQMAENIGRVAPKAMSKHFLGKPVTKVLVGRDIRNSSESLHKALVKGLLSQGVIVCDIGICSTPKFYFAGWYYGFEAGIMVTASHNPKEYGGFKFIEKHAHSLTYKTGINKIEAMWKHLPKDKEQGQLIDFKIDEDYERFLREQIKPGKKLKIVVDAGNSVGALDTKVLQKEFNVVKMNYQLDGSFPARGPNPSIPKYLEALGKKVVSAKADLGVAFDGDADRVVFVDEKGHHVLADWMLLLLIKQLPRGERAVYESRLTKNIQRVAKERGVRLAKAKVGHSFIAQTMKKADAAVGAEYSGHYLFREFKHVDSAILGIINILNILRKEKKPLSALINPEKTSFPSLEMNLTVKDIPEALKKIKKAFKGKKEYFDGITIDMGDKWFNARPSNTEPVLRVRAETPSEQETNALLAEIKKVIESKPKK